jgi:hypothetical protein
MWNNRYKRSQEKGVRSQEFRVKILLSATSYLLPTFGIVATYGISAMRESIGILRIDCAKHDDRKIKDRAGLSAHKYR